MELLVTAEVGETGDQTLLDECARIGGPRIGGTGVRESTALGCTGRPKGSGDTVVRTKTDCRGAGNLSLAPELVGNAWSDWWVYWVGPLVGAVIGWGVFKAVTSGPDE